MLYPKQPSHKYVACNTGSQCGNESQPPCITISHSDHSPKAVFRDKAVYWPTQKKDLAASYGRFMADDIGQTAAAELYSEASEPWPDTFYSITSHSPISAPSNNSQIPLIWPLATLTC